MANPRVFADFHNADPLGRVRLTCAGTFEDLSRHHVELHEGLVLTLYTDDLDDQGQSDELLVDGTVLFSQEEQCWVASIDWAAIHHASTANRSADNGRADATAQAPVQCAHQ